MVRMGRGGWAPAVMRWPPVERPALEARWPLWRGVAMVVLDAKLIDELDLRLHPLRLVLDAKLVVGLDLPLHPLRLVPPRLLGLPRRLVLPRPVVLLPLLRLVPPRRLVPRKS